MSDSQRERSGSRFRRFLPDPASIRDRWGGVVPHLKARARLLRRHLRSGDRSALDDLDEAYVEEGARTVTDTDLDTVVEEADAIEERFRDHGPLRRLMDDGQLLLDLIRDVRRGRYQHVPVWTLSAAGFALLYVLNPFDVVPDAIPVLGVLDDAAVVSACLALLEQDLYDYRAWRHRLQTAESSPDRSEQEASGGELGKTEEKTVR